MEDFLFSKDKHDLEDYPDGDTVDKVSQFGS